MILNKFTFLSIIILMNIIFQTKNIGNRRGHSFDRFHSDDFLFAVSADQSGFSADSIIFRLSFGENEYVEGYEPIAVPYLYEYTFLF